RVPRFPVAYRCHEAASAVTPDHGLSVPCSNRQHHLRKMPVLLVAPPGESPARRPPPGRGAGEPPTPAGARATPPERGQGCRETRVPVATPLVEPAAHCG